jgi:electron transfer flavoprotein alpha subunit
MSCVIVYSENPALASELVGFGKTAGAQTYALALGADAAQALANCGADGVLAIQGDHPLIEDYAKGIAKLLTEHQADVFAVGATAQGRDLAARVAGYLDCAILGDVTTVTYDGTSVTATRTIYGGSVSLTETAPTPAVITTGPGHFDAASGAAQISNVDVEADERVELVEQAPIEHTGVDITKAQRVVSIGMGVRSEDDLPMIKDLADAMGAELGCSRGIAEDRKWLPPEQYVGLSGASIAPDVCLTVGISGQAQHVAGIRDAKVIAAINSDANAPIFRSADYGIVGDLYEMVPAITAALKK